MVAELAFLDARSSDADPESRRLRDALDASSARLVAAVQSPGAHYFSCELIKAFTAPDAPSRKWGVRLLEHFFINNKQADYEQQVKNKMLAFFSFFLFVTKIMITNQTSNAHTS